MSSQQDNLKKAASDFAPHILPNIHLLRSMARLKGVNLKNYSDVEIVQIVKEACEIALGGCQVFTFKTVYQT